MKILFFLLVTLSLSSYAQSDPIDGIVTSYSIKSAAYNHTLVKLTTDEKKKKQLLSFWIELKKNLDKT
jgi:hypothetical protein